jgi:uncharacterized protein (DUF4415 family)
MTKKNRLTNNDGEVGDLSQLPRTVFKPAEEVLPASLLKKVSVRGQQKSPVKDRITIRLSHEVVTKFRATGHGWQTRVDAALKDWLSTHPSIS